MNPPAGKNTRYVSGVTQVVVGCDDDYIGIDTSQGAVSVFLPNIIGSGILNSPKKFYINDISGNAPTNNITIYGSNNTVNSDAQCVITNAFGSAECSASNTSEWIVVLDKQIGLFKTYPTSPILTTNLGGVLYTLTTKVAVANTVAETSVLSGGGVGTLTLPSNFFVAGRTIKITGMGIHSAVANPNITIKIKIGNTVFLTTGVVACGNSSNALMEVRALITCVSAGVSGTFNAQGKYAEEAGGQNNFQMVNTGLVSLDTTQQATIDITAQWGTASASNTITFTNVAVEILN